MSTSFLFLVFLWVCMISVVYGYSAFDCQGSWTIQYEDTYEKMELVQKWLYAWQHTCEKKVFRAIATNNLPFASSIQTAVHGLITSIELDQVYRPDGAKSQHQWHWADENAGSCTLGLQAVDCFSRPLSSCGYEWDGEYKPGPSDLSSFTTEALDSCNIARKAQKSLQWVHGQMLHYVLRPRLDIHQAVKKNFDSIFGNLHPSHLHHTVSNLDSSLSSSSSNSSVEAGTRNASTIGVFIRGGVPNDGRYAVPLDAYMKYIDLKAAELAKKGMPVAFVYLCSDRQDGMGISDIEAINLKYNRTFEFKILNHTKMYFEEEIPEYMAFKWKEKITIPPNKKIYTEYLTDFEILASVDVFISAYSSVYPLVAALRIARHSDTLPRSSSCFVDIHRKENPYLYCEGDGLETTRELWRHYFGGYNIDYAFD